jgi:hypothetical protein
MRKFLRNTWMRPILFGCLLSSVSIALANSSGKPVYQVTSENEVTGYARVIRLAHSGSLNGELLATFEHWYNNVQNPTVPLIIRKSTDGGNNWSTVGSAYDPAPNTEMFEPVLFEFPAQMGTYPAGTLLLVANSIHDDVNENFETWRSTDHGATWNYVNTFMTAYSGASPSTGIWEPFLYVDSYGELVCVFSDERQAPTRSQFIGEVISTDGGTTWSTEKDVVVGPLSADRPGMPTVAQLGNGDFILASEDCGPTYNCSIHTATSPDGSTWAGPVGSPVSTADGRTAYGSPYIVYTPTGGESPYGTVLLSSFREYPTPSSLSIAPNPSILAPENDQVIYLNNYNGTGAWSWMGAPYLAQTPNSQVNVNYSPALLLSSDGSSITEMSSTGGGAFNDQVTVGTILTGTEPYNHTFTDPFQGGTDAGWVDYGGTWSVSGGVYTESSGTGANKAIAGPTYWDDYTLAGDVMLSSDGQAGFIVRASNPSVGVDTLNGYYIGLETTDGTLFVGREDGGWTGLGSIPLPDDVLLNTWYHITVQVSGSTLTITETPAAGGTTTTLTVTDSHFLTGAIGVRDFNTTASWRNISVI